ncbi:MAG: Tol-Pal system beta propeller repeat protein TolB [Pseudomonadota bacterium]|nr:Tol-Pal system beta propeller repeat protein TolB [Pseudomonadota bacterium]
MKLAKIVLATMALCLTGAAAAQTAPPQPITIAVPQLPATRNVATPHGDAVRIGANISELIVADLRSSGLFVPLAPEAMRAYSRPEATAPLFNEWRKRGARALLFGFVDPREDGRLAVGCYVYDVNAGREVGRQGFLVAPRDWRRAAHRCADAALKGMTGQPGIFDTRIAYIAETGDRMQLIKRLAIMDRDGTNHDYLTPGAVTVLAPRFSPDGERIAFVSYADRVPQVRVMSIADRQERSLAPPGGMSFAPSFSPDGRQIVFSGASNGNTDIYITQADGGQTYRLTSTPGIDTAASFSPDGRQIVFESDRSGSQQLYVMNADGSDQRRISFGGARYGSPVWSPTGDLIAFTRIAGEAMQIATMAPDGTAERLLTNGTTDEAPTWAPSGQMILFNRSDPATGRSRLFNVPQSGGAPRQVSTPQDASDASWSPVRS